MISRAEVVELLGDLDDGRLSEIVKLEPSLKAVELAAICLEGRMHVLTRSGHHLSATAAQILKIVLSDEVALEGGR